MSDDVLHEFIKSLFLQLNSVTNELGAVRCALGQLHGPDFGLLTQEWLQKITESPENKAHREWIERLDLLEILAAFDRGKAPLQ